MITKLDPVNITRMVVSGIIAGVELGINYFAMHSGLQTPEFTALMAQNIVVFPTVGYFTAKISAAGVTESTANANTSSSTVVK